MPAKSTIKQARHAPNWLKSSIGSAVLVIISIPISIIIVLQFADMKTALNTVVDAYANGYAQRIKIETANLKAESSKIGVQAEKLKNIVDGMVSIKQSVDDHEKRIVAIEKYLKATKGK